MSDANIHLISIVEAQSNKGFKPMLLGQKFEAGTMNENRIVEEDTYLDDPYARGLEEGQRMAETLFQIERTNFNKMLASADAIQPEPSEELAVLISEAVERLVREIVGNAPIDQEWLNVQAKRAASMVADCDSARTMWVHPDDLPLIDEAAVGLKLVADPNSVRGSIRIDCSEGWIEHGRANYLDQLRGELGLKGNEA